MKLSPLKIEQYFITKYEFQANPDFNVENEAELYTSDLQVSSKIDKIQESENDERYHVCLSVDSPIIQGKNIPYSISATIMGFVSIHPEYKADNKDAIIRLNSTSMLFTTLREYIRSQTALGPYNSLILPTITFQDEDFIEAKENK